NAVAPGRPSMLSGMAEQHFAVVTCGVDAIEKDVGTPAPRSRAHAMSQQPKRRLAEPEAKQEVADILRLAPGSPPGGCRLDAKASGFTRDAASRNDGVMAAVADCQTAMGPVVDAQLEAPVSVHPGKFKVGLAERNRKEKTGKPPDLHAEES